MPLIERRFINAVVIVRARKLNCGTDKSAYIFR